MKKTISIIGGISIILLVVFFISRYSAHGGRPADTSASLVGEESSDAEMANLGTVENSVYTNSAYGFSLAVPRGLVVTNFNDGNGTTILVKSAESQTSSSTFQMQIFVSPFDEDIALNSARIKKDIPDLKMIEPIEIKTDGVATVAFYSTENGQKNREIWFVHGGFLYQVMARAVDDNMTGGVMDGWKWKEN